MAARSTRNRYRTEPFGRDFADVLKRGKAFHNPNAFMMVEYGGIWTALSLPTWGEMPAGAIVFKKIGARWACK